jgi:pilus assembly protein Flp/PilA
MASRMTIKVGAPGRDKTRGGVPVIATVKQLLRDDQGATAVEYGMIVAGIAAVIVTIVFALGVKLNTPFTTVSDKLP